jgi:DNA-binding response OmpR family regulator
MEEIGVKTILIVDDEPMVRSLVAISLRDHNYRTLEAQSGEEGKAILEQGTRIDALVTDVKMPGMNGFELSRHARSMIPGLPILLMSGFIHSNESVSDLFRNGTVHFLPKPFSLDQIKLHLKWLLAA